jgi:cell division septation protein DedD
VKPLSAPPARAGADEPLALVPAAERGATREPIRTQVARAEGSGATEPAATGSGGGYAVQLTSQRTEAEAQAAYRSLRTKFPQELGSHAPIIRRADLGAKGTYYRALVGPYGSAEAAAEVCSKLKAAGGSCIVQRN